MKNIFKSWKQLTVVVLMIAFLVGVWAYQAETVAAAPPCSLCEARLYNCLAGCGPPSCVDDCYDSVQGCFNVCICS
ncbi:MAG: hypothetical protein V3T83_13805 [Acidobacteriota bacterium]